MVGVPEKGRIGPAKVISSAQNMLLKGEIGNQNVPNNFKYIETDN